MAAILLDINGRSVKSTEVTLQDLYDLYQNFIEKYGHFPTGAELDSAHNMPQMRIVQHVLREAGVPYTDLCLRFGKTGHARSSAKDYALYLQRIVEYAQTHGTAPNTMALTQLGLPSCKWLIQNCPDASVKTWLDFTDWLGIQSCHKYTKAEVIKLLTEYQEALGHPIRYRDLKGDSAPVSGIVVNRLFGTLTKAKEELSLAATLPNQPQPFEYYRDVLRTTVLNFQRITGEHEITWRDIESGAYADPAFNHKTYAYAFRRGGVNLKTFLKELGVTMAPSSFASRHTFDDGELAMSAMERDVSTFLREQGFVYGRDYYRDYKYSNFTAATGRSDCDYYFPAIRGGCCVEVAGIIYAPRNLDWRTHEFASKPENDYRDKMIAKEQILLDASVPHLFLFQYDMNSGVYKQKLSEFLLFENKFTAVRSA